MIKLTRRALVRQAAGTVAVAAPLRNSRAQDLQGIGALQPLHEPKKLDLHWLDADGGAKSLADYAGKAVVLNLWATWCVPCVREMPALDDLAALVGKDGIVVLPVSSDHGGAPVVERFYAERGIKHLPVMLDPQSNVAHAMGVRGIPTTFLIDKAGNELASLEGSADWSSPDAVTVVRKIASS